ncbi:hypothetical protein CU097_003503, partial [Rhizopus azygosporus]
EKHGFVEAIISKAQNQEFEYSCQPTQQDHQSHFMPKSTFYIETKYHRSYINRDVYRSIIPTKEMKNIDYSRQQKKMDNKMNSVIDDVLDKLKLDTITTTNTDTLHTMIDELKHKESDKRSSNYQVLNEVERV